MAGILLRKKPARATIQCYDDSHGEPGDGQYTSVHHRTFFRIPALFANTLGLLTSRLQ